MPAGTSGQERPADVMGAVVMIGCIATGELSNAIKLWTNKSTSGFVGAAARARSMLLENRTEIANKAASARWK